MDDTKVIAVRRYGSLIVVFLSTADGRLSFRFFTCNSESMRMAAKFSLGQIVATPGAISAMAESGQTPDFFLARHVAGDWGEVDSEDWQLNDQAVVDGSRLLFAYKTSIGEKLWIITEATGDQGNRAATTLLLPNEY